MKAENCSQAMSNLAQPVEANTKAIEENGKAVAEMVNLLRAKVIQWDEGRCITTLMEIKYDVSEISKQRPGRMNHKPRWSPISDGECFYAEKKIKDNATARWA